MEYGKTVQEPTEIGHMQDQLLLSSVNGVRNRKANAESHGELEEEKPVKRDILYGIEDRPPWFMTFFIGFQHYLLLLGGTITPPLIVTPAMCIGDDDLGKSEVIGTVFFIDGIATLLQTTFGTRLPIVQGGSYSYLPPIFAVLALPRWKCPENPPDFSNVTSGMLNETLFEWRRGVWTSRMREIQGSLALAAIFQILIGATGILGFMMRFIGPLTIAPTISLIGLSLYGAAADYSASHWGISVLTMALITLFAQYMRNILVPLPSYSKEKGFHLVKYQLFALFPIILAIGITWSLCAILTATNCLPSNPEKYGYKARTDTKMKVLEDAQWFRVPYPGQWGMPTWSAAAVIGIMAGMIAGIIESIGDYHACAHISGASNPPVHAINRGVLFEGIAIAFAGVMGGTSGVTSYSHNIGAIGITRVASRRVIQVGAFITIGLALLGKFGALFVTLPEPIFGGIFMVLFGLVMAVGVSSLQSVDLNSSRNLYIFGFSILLGLAVPSWMGSHPDAINTGNDTVDQVLFVLLNTPMLIGGLTGFILDNTIPGTAEERGLTKWKNEATTSDTSEPNARSPYDLPLGMKYLRKAKWTRFIPFSPTYYPSFDCCPCKAMSKTREQTGDEGRSPKTNINTELDTEV